MNRISYNTLFISNLFYHILFHLFFYANEVRNGIDTFYYRIVAERIASGEGATVWHRFFLHGPYNGPPDVPIPADIWWMPLPSRILVPEVLLGGYGLITNILLAATWSSIAYRISILLKLPERTARYAAFFACTGGSFMVSNTESIVLTGTLGGLACVFALQTKNIWGLVSLGVTSAFIALTRNEGFILSGLLGLAVFIHYKNEDWKKALWYSSVPVVAGVGAYGAWSLRNIYMLGSFEEWLHLKYISANALSYKDVWVSNPDMPKASFMDRVQFFGENTTTIYRYWLKITQITLIPFLGYGLWKYRTNAVGVFTASALLFLPVFTLFNGLSIAVYGTIEKTGVVCFIGVCVLAAKGVTRLSHPWVIALLWLGLDFYLPSKADNDTGYTCSEEVTSKNPAMDEYLCGKATMLDPEIIVLPDEDQYELIHWKNISNFFEVGE